MYMHPQVMQDTGQVFQSAQVACPAGSHAGQQCLLSPPYFFIVRNIEHDLQYTWYATIVFGRNKNEFIGGCEDIVFQLCELGRFINILPSFQGDELWMHALCFEYIEIVLGYFRGTAANTVGAGYDRILFTHCTTINS